MFPTDGHVMEVTLLEIIDKQGSYINLTFTMTIY